MLAVQDVYKTYRMGETELHALRGVSLTIEDGDFVAIMGPSGSGKSTLMHLLGLLDVPTKGSYKINGREVSGLNEEELAVLRRGEIGFIFQQFNLLPRLTALENVALPQLYSRAQPDEPRTRQLLEAVGLGNRIGHRTNELSGGQQQRVAIARSLINQPRVILADEPTGNLDSASEKEIMGILQSLNDQGITLVIVTHEEEIGALAKRRIRMRDGQIQSDERLVSIESSAKRPSNTVGPVTFGIQQAFEHLRQGLKTLASNKVRTGLSMLGILIGVAAVIAMLAIGRGAQESIQKQLSSLGSNLLILRAGAMRVGGVSQEAGATTRLTTDDAREVEQKISFAKGVAPNVNGRGQLTFGNKNWSSQVLGTTPPYADMRASQPQAGRFFTMDENQRRARVAVLGTTVVKELFGDENPIGEMIKINRISFQVIGVLPAKGSTGWRDQDDVVIIPVSTAMHRLLGKNHVDSIEIEMEAAADLAQAQDDIIALMLSRHRVPPSRSEEAFEVRNMAELQTALMESNRTMSILLASIAAISLLVGGIGIMNIMLVSVTERTREVGLRKAVGARPKDVLFQFLIESVVVSAIGGVFGILCGWVITLTLSSFLGWNTVVSPAAVSVSFLFSASVGVIFGVYPARKAAALNPIEALRYE